MSVLAWIEEQRQLKLKQSNVPLALSEQGRGLWTRCDCCGVILYIKLLKRDLYVCSGCGHHILMPCVERIHSLIDSGTWNATYDLLSPCDPLVFEDERVYQERLADTQEKMSLQDAVLTGTGMLNKIPIALGVMEFQFMGGSMGSVVGEKLTRLIESATISGIAIVIVCASGGARMQEGIFSLMQMAKVSAALYVHQVYAKLFYVAVVTAPTTGGVTASFAMLGDVVMAEPEALIGFAGRRVIQETLMEELPEEFQTSEYLLYHGMLDLVVPRYWIRQALYELLLLHKGGPLRERGYIPYGVQAGLTPMEEEDLREEWKSHSWSQVTEEIFDQLSEELRSNLLAQVNSPAYQSDELGLDSSSKGSAPEEALEWAFDATKEVESFWMEEQLDYDVYGWLGYRQPLTPTPQDAPDNPAEEEAILNEQFLSLEQNMKDLEGTIKKLMGAENEEEVDTTEMETISHEILEVEQLRIAAEYAHHMEDYLPRAKRDMCYRQLEQFKYEIGERGGEYMYTYRTPKEEKLESEKIIQEMKQVLESSSEEKEALFTLWREEAKARQQLAAEQAEAEKQAQAEANLAKANLPLSPAAKLVAERIALLVSEPATNPIARSLKELEEIARNEKEKSELSE
uniref:Acetyl-coenzyme A carboxylase carboxyl transferase subunit beta, chloroplastic n=1 Tax=Nephroselmis olivacea TaxID=31312 RepID=Q9TL11_NEPOL|nr:acetyl-CoA carboxylase beta subunit [Nephroselmis olivacea]AAD54805.1 beta subunit of acetyl-CoA carboxylase carboxytransferase [Nephroselmis olivacea]